MKTSFRRALIAGTQCTRMSQSQGNYRLNSRFSTSSDFELKQRVLDTALRYVPTVGWTEDAVAMAIKEVGYDSFSHKIVDRGAVDLVTNFMKRKRKHVNTILEDKYGKSGSEETTPEKRDERIYAAIEAHLEYISPFIPSWPSALAVLSDPLQVADTVQLMTDVADDICHHAGLKSSRLDWYTDRGLVLAIFCSAELFMLTDYSHNLQDTRFVVLIYTQQKQISVICINWCTCIT